MNTETRVRGVHSSRPGGYTHNDAGDGLRHDQGLRIRIMNKKGRSLRPLAAGGFMQASCSALGFVYMTR